MHWASPEERRALGQARRKQLGRHQNEALHPKARPASALELVARSMRGRIPDLIQPQIPASPWRSRRSATFAVLRRA